MTSNQYERIAQITSLTLIIVLDIVKYKHVAIAQEEGRIYKSTIINDYGVCDSFITYHTIYFEYIDEIVKDST
jgi:hypothetical protein